MFGQDQNVDGVVWQLFVVVYFLCIGVFFLLQFKWCVIQDLKFDWSIQYVVYYFGQGWVDKVVFDIQG